MSCEIFVSGQGKDRVVGIVCSRKREIRKCAFCGRPADYLCDYPVSEGKTCDKPICKKCKTIVGIDFDYCPTHAKEYGLLGGVNK